LQITLLWDFHVLAVLERWQRHYGPHIRAWFLALGELEALASFASVARDNPHWGFPTLDETSEKLTAREIGHPLLADKARVTNDVEVGPVGTFLLVTGSNMSGKSTLLRSLGTNVVLAQAGAPVCATELQIPPVLVETSMRIRDSLQDGVSFYMAELRRLKQVVDQAEIMADAPDRRLLYLLDEVLQGTNSKERHLAVVRVMAHLLECGAIGAISTHDLELATSDPLSGVCQAVHFRETLQDVDGKQSMTFDYKLRPGVATTSNALKLLEMVGLARPSSP
jgi:DNA mismatch repair ATPase MutS